MRRRRAGLGRPLRALARLLLTLGDEALTQRLLLRQFGLVHRARRGDGVVPLRQPRLHLAHREPQLRGRRRPSNLELRLQRGLVLLLRRCARLLRHRRRRRQLARVRLRRRLRRRRRRLRRRDGVAVRSFAAARSASRWALIRSASRCEPSIPSARPAASPRAARRAAAAPRRRRVAPRLEPLLRPKFLAHAAFCSACANAARRSPPAAAAALGGGAAPSTPARAPPRRGRGAARAATSKRSSARPARAAVTSLAPIERAARVAAWSTPRGREPLPASRRSRTMPRALDALLEELLLGVLLGLAPGGHALDPLSSSWSKLTPTGRACPRPVGQWAALAPPARRPWRALDDGAATTFSTWSQPSRPDDASSIETSTVRSEKALSAPRLRSGWSEAGGLR